MTGLVFALGVVLVLAGAVSVVSGIPIVQLERGWTEVIAGTVAISGGVVTLALGAVLLQLRALTGATERLAEPAAAARPEPVLHLADDAIEMRPTRAPDEPVHVAEAAVEDPRAHEAVEPAAAEHKVALWAGRPSQVDDDEPLQTVVPHAAASATETLPPVDDGSGYEAGIADARTALPSIPPVEREPEPPRRLSTASAGVASPEAAPPRPASRFGDWRSRPLLRSRTAPPEVPPPLFDGGEAPLAEAPEVHAPSADTAFATEPPPPFDDAPTAEAAVIGRYQAGASSYTMYADGAIDVETENGDRHRFSSMDELKAFIARQEQVVG